MKSVSRNRLTQITIRGYRSVAYDKPLALDLSDVNLLLGANGAGKSNIICFFQLLSYMMSGSLQKYVAKSGSNQNFLHYGSKKTPALSAEIRFEDEKNTDIYRFTLTAAARNALIISDETIEWRKAGKTTPYQEQIKTDFYESDLSKSDSTAAKVLWRILSNIKVYQFNDSSLAAPMRQPAPVDSAFYLQAQANNLAQFLYYIKNNYSQSYKKIVSYVRSVVPQFSDFYLVPERNYVSLKWIDTSLNDYVFSPEQLSDGSIRFIALAALLLQPKETMPSVIIIDEPELGLHPYAIDQLAEMIHDASHRVQVIVATQSAALIDSFSPENVTVIERDEENNCSLANKLSSSELASWLEDYSLSELWDKNVIGGRPA